MIVFHDDVVSTHLHAHARAVMNQVVRDRDANTTGCDTTGVLVKDAEVMNVVVDRLVFAGSERGPVTAIETDTIAARATDVIAASFIIKTTIDANGGAGEAGHVFKDATTHDAIFSLVESDRVFHRADKSNALDDDILCSFPQPNQTGRCDESDLMLFNRRTRPDVECTGARI